MKRFLAPVSGLILASMPFILAAHQTSQEPTSDKVFKNIKVFNGVPAKDLIPSMEFMSASLKYKCADCHEKDFSAETSGKQTAREMILMQRDINEKHFGGRLVITCNSCHNGKERPANTPLPAAATMRHKRGGNLAKPADLMTKYITTVGSNPAQLTATGTMTTPFSEDGKPVVAPLQLVQAQDGRFKVVSGAESFGFDGKVMFRNGAEIQGDQAMIFGRIGRFWRGEHAFDGLTNPTTTGSDTVDKMATTVVRATREQAGTTDELYFDNATGFLDRWTSSTRSTLGTVVTVYDYRDYKTVGGTKVPMKIIVTFAGGEVLTMDLKTAKVGDKVDDAAFSMK